MNVQSINPVVRQLSQFATDKIFAAVRGDYKDFKNASKAFGKLASENLELLSQVEAPKVSGIPLFSKLGRRIMKVLLLDKFRIKTKEEKAVRDYLKQQKLQEEAHKYMRMG